MRGNELLDRMDLVDAAYVEEASQNLEKTRWMPAGWVITAACLALLIGMVRNGYLPIRMDDPTVPVGTSQSAEETEPLESIQDTSPVIMQDEPDWTPYYNEYSDGQIASDGRIQCPAYFSESLSPEELKALTPETRPAWMELSGYAEFAGCAGMNEAPELLGILLYIATDLPDAEMSLHIRRYDYLDVIIEGFEPVTSTLAEVDYTLFQWQTMDGMTHLKCEAIREGFTWRYILSVPTEQVEQGKDTLEKVVQSFVSVPYFEHITPEYIPEYIDEKLTPAEALAEPELGVYFLPSVPDGFSRETIRRYKDYRTDVLYGLWSKGLDDLYWSVSRLTEQDLPRITAASDRENFDLSLYPIPRADSVPDELRQIVDNPIFLAEELTLELVQARAYRVEDSGDTDGWRMHFSVLYDDILVEITAKGMEPEWIFRQLRGLYGA